MTMIEKTIRNERGNIIEISVKPGAATDLLVLTLKGPKSTSTNEITKGEARIVALLLNKYLS